MTANTTTANAPRPTLEELVDRLIDAVFGLDEPAQPVTSPARAIHEARRLRHTGEHDAALGVFAALDLSGSTDGERRWAYAEFLDLARRTFSEEQTQVYRPGTGRAAVLAPRDEGTLEVRAVLGMRWRPGKIVSQRSLRGLKPLARDGAS
ncbi:MAG: hypothetical protein OXD50_11660 [Chloroflexi bacterium]|nr:hypothetical protein [Chloroflexota bacterium]